MGKTTCYYDTSDPEVKSYCDAFQRNHGKKTIESVKPATIIATAVVERYEVDTEEQLSLF